jgi:hypothetical protein
MADALPHLVIGQHNLQPVGVDLDVFGVVIGVDDPDFHRERPFAQAIGQVQKRPTGPSFPRPGWQGVGG